MGAVRCTPPLDILTHTQRFLACLRRSAGGDKRRFQAANAADIQARAAGNFIDGKTMET
jgi:hypothetical protein